VTTAEDARRDVTLRRFVERFALVLTESGLPRMAARVFAYVLADDAERYTATALAHGLGVSPAAISGAVRHLVRLGYLARERRPGERTDTYRIDDRDVWGSIILQQDPVLRGYEEVAAEGARVLGDTAGGRRLRETREFFAFLRAEQPRIIERWHAHRRAPRDGRPTTGSTSASAPAPGLGHPGPERPGPAPPGPEPPGAERPGPEPPGAERPGPEPPGAERPGPEPPGAAAGSGRSPTTGG
jgi:predicted transcriptional regulator